MEEKLFDAQLEATYIATIIANPHFLLVENTVQPNFFYSRENQCLFWGIQSLVNKGVETIDALNLETILSSNAGVKRVITKYGLEDLGQYIEMSQYVARNSYEEYKILEEQIVTYAFRRELRSFSVRLGNECNNPQVSLEELNDFCNDGLAEITDRYAYGADSVLLGEKIDDIWADICDKRTASGYGIPFKIDRLNDYLTLVPGELTLVAGATGKGKSALFLVEGLHKAVTLGVPTLIIDSELTDMVWLPRAIASISGIAVSNVKTGNYDEEGAHRIEDAIETLRKAPLIHEYVNSFDKFRIEGLVRKWKNRMDLGLVIFDYLKPGAIYGAAEVSQSLGLATDFLKNTISTEINVPVLAGVQMNEQTGGVADSQKPIRYADALLRWEEKPLDLIARDGVEKGNFRMFVDKNRNGMSTVGDDDYIDVMFEKNLMRICGAEQHEIPEDLPFL